MSGGPSPTKNAAVVSTFSVTSLMPERILPGPRISQHL